MKLLLNLAVILGICNVSTATPLLFFNYADLLEDAQRPDVKLKDLLKGDWQGHLENKTDGNSFVRIFIKENTARISINKKKRAEVDFCSDEGIQTPSNEHKSFHILGNNALFTWMSSGENDNGTRWTETQVLSLSYVNESTLEVAWIRHVNNIKDEGDDLTVPMFGKGILKKSTDSSQMCE